MSDIIEDEDDDGFSDSEFEPEDTTNSPPIKGKSDARRRIEELMERRRLRNQLDDPYREMFDEDL
ncbi:MAG: hypothetical protein PVF13_09825 [Chromatiales bacterium]|jgi:hypothetical protein